MKLKIYSLLMIAFMLIASSITMVNADINSTNKSQISITKTVKVNKTYKIKKLLKSNGNNVDYYSFKSSNKKVAKVSKKGTVTGLKAGKATITITSKVIRVDSLLLQEMVLLADHYHYMTAVI